MKRQLLIAASLVPFVACIPGVGDSPEPEAEPTFAPGDGGVSDPPDAGVAPDAGACVDEEACDEDTCGTVRDACDEWVDCGPCVSDEELDVLMAPSREIVDHLLNTSYMHDIFDLDPQAIRDHAADAFLSMPDADAARLAAMNRAMRGFNNGHSGVYLNSSLCRSVSGGDMQTTAYGVCATPKDDHFIISHQPGSTNPLALLPGEEVIAVNGQSGEMMIDALTNGPLCGGGAGNASVRQDHAAAALFASLRPDDTLRVRGLDGVVRDIVVRDAGAPTVSCRFPAGLLSAPLVTATRRDDNVVVLQLTRFFLFADEPGYSEDWMLNMESMIQQIEDALTAVDDDVVGVVWDARGNAGGTTLVALEIVNGMLGAQSATLASCDYRNPNTDPITYSSGGGFFTVTPNDRLRIDLPTALVIDGFSISAADYFAYAVQQTTDVRIFGRPSAGAYGGGGMSTTLQSDTQVTLAFDPFLCRDADGVPLETRSVEPHEVVELDPDDVAQGIDTVLERAATWVKDAP